MSASELRRFLWEFTYLYAEIPNVYGVSQRKAVFRAISRLSAQNRQLLFHLWVPKTMHEARIQDESSGRENLRDVVGGAVPMLLVTNRSVDSLNHIPPSFRTCDVSAQDIR